MYDLNEIAGYVLCDVEDAGIERGDITGFVVDSRAVRRCGQCRPRRWDDGITYEIGISKFMLDDKNISYQHLCDIVAHEILHTVDGCLNHGKNWKRAAAKLMRAFPEYHIERTDKAAAELDAARDDAGVVYRRYGVECTKCGKVIYRTRRSKLIDHPERYRHLCGGDFRRIDDL